MILTPQTQQWPMAADMAAVLVDFLSALAGKWDCWMPPTATVDVGLDS
jgi:hypothetical protein